MVQWQGCSLCRAVALWLASTILAASVQAAGFNMAAYILAGSLFILLVLGTCRCPADAAIHQYRRVQSGSCVAAA